MQIKVNIRLDLKVEISHKFNLERSMVYPTYPYRVEKVMKLYCTIFDVFEMDSTGNKRIAKFKGMGNILEFGDGES